MRLRLQTAGDWEEQLILSVNGSRAQSYLLAYWKAKSFTYFKGNDRLSGQTGYSKNEIQICVSGLCLAGRTELTQVTWVPVVRKRFV